MSAEFTGSQEVARFLIRIVRAYQSTEEAQQQLRLLLNDFGMLKADGENLDLDRVLDVAKVAGSEEDG